MPTNIGGVALGDLILGASTSGQIERNVTSTLTFTQEIRSQFNLVQSSLSLSHTISFVMIRDRTVASTLTQTQQINIVKPASVTSTLTLSQNIVETHSKPRTVTGTLTLSQTVVGAYVGARLIVSGITWSHIRGYNAVFNRSIASTLSFNQTIVGNKCKHVSQTLPLSQSITYVKCKHVKHTLEFQPELLYDAIFVRPINTILGVSQQFTKTAKFNRTVNQSLNLSQTIVQARVKGVTHTLNLSQTIVAFAARNVKNTLTLSQAISYNHVSVRSVTSQYIPTSTIVGNRTQRLLVHHGFGMNSIVDQYKVVSQSISHTINFVSETPKQLFRRTVAQTLTQSQTVGYTPVYPRTVTSNLQFNQTVAVNNVLSRTVTSTLVFLPNRQVYVGMGDVDNYLIENIQYSLVPAYLQGKKNRPMCVLQTNNSAITLPAPEWGDSENYGGVFTIRRSMNNIPYTHVRTLSLRKLNLPFVLAKRKAWELREFLIANNSDVMTLTTWKGDKWFVNLTTNPLELVVRGRYDVENEKVSVELEFEGLKVM